MSERDFSCEVRRLNGLTPRLLLVSLAAVVLGGGGVAASVVLGEQGSGRLLQSYLVSFSFYLSVSLGALFFVLLQHVTRSGWSVVVRRVAEAMAANLVVLAPLAAPVVVGMHQLYHWSRAEAVANDPMLAAKAGYLNPTFFVIRLCVYFVVWIALALVLLRTSLAQDASNDPRATLRMERLSAPGMVLFALTINFAAFDLLMSLDPHWFSTIFGVYFFSSSVVGFLAVFALVLLGLQLVGRLRWSVTVDHYHDVGKLLFAFVVFWAYIAFSQYLLIWYGNLPEETSWFFVRQSGPWLGVSLLLLGGHFFLPFLVLLSRFVKRRPVLLGLAGLWMVAMHWLDLYWLAVPSLSPEHAPFGLLDVCCFVGLGGVWLAAATLWLRRRSLLAVGDPRLAESLAFENA